MSGAKEFPEARYRTGALGSDVVLEIDFDGEVKQLRLGPELARVMARELESWADVIDSREENAK